MVGSRSEEGLAKGGHLAVLIFRSSGSGLAIFSWFAGSPNANTTVFNAYTIELYIRLAMLSSTANNDYHVHPETSPRAGCSTKQTDWSGACHRNPRNPFSNIFLHLPLSIRLVPCFWRPRSRFDRVGSKAQAMTGGNKPVLLPPKDKRAVRARGLEKRGLALPFSEFWVFQYPYNVFQEIRQPITRSLASGIQQLEPDRGLDKEISRVDKDGGCWKTIRSSRVDQNQRIYTCTLAPQRSTIIPLSRVITSRFS